MSAHRQHLKTRRLRWKDWKVLFRLDRLFRRVQHERELRIRVDIYHHHDGQPSGGLDKKGGSE